MLITKEDDDDDDDGEGGQGQGQPAAAHEIGIGIGVESFSFESSSVPPILSHCLFNSMCVCVCASLLHFTNFDLI